MSLSISNIVNVQLNTAPKSASRKDFGVVALFTPESGNVFTDEKTRYVYVEEQRDVESYFGVGSETARAAQPFFSQSPRAKQMVICRWQKSPLSIPASANTLSGAVVSNTLDEFKTITDGVFAIRIGDAKYMVSGLDLSQSQSLSDIAAKLNTVLSKAKVTVSFDNNGERFVIRASATGDNPTTLINYAFDDLSEGTYIGSMLKLEDGQAKRIIGKGQVSLSAEKVSDALFNVAEVNNSWYGFLFAAQLTDEQIETCANYALANEKLFGANVIQSEHLEWSLSNIYKKLVDASNYRVLPMFDKDDMYSCSSAMARLLAMNFSANNSTITLKFKTEPGITADEITLTELNKAKRLGINVYTTFDDTPMITEGTVLGGRFADEIVILDWFKDAVQKEVFARLYKSPTKVPLTDKGQAILISAVEKVCQEGVNNGAFAPGVWTGDSFGKLATNDFLETGYYVYAAPMDTLSDSDREQRKATPIQVAVKLAGAIHSSDVIINFNR